MPNENTETPVADVVAKLTPPQREVMKWLGQSWTAYARTRGVYEINGQAVFRRATFDALARLGLVIEGEHAQFNGTARGRSVTEAMLDR